VDPWRSRQLKYAEFQSLVQSIHRLARIYSASISSINQSINQSVNQSIFVYLSMIAIVDCLIRAGLSDHVCPVTLVYDGQSLDQSATQSASQSMYVLSLTTGSGESINHFTSSIDCFDPSLMIARGHRIEYFTHLSNRSANQSTNQSDNKPNNQLFDNFIDSSMYCTTIHSKNDATLRFVKQVMATGQTLSPSTDQSDNQPVDRAVDWLIDRRGYGGRAMTETEALAKLLYTDRFYDRSNHSAVDEPVDQSSDQSNEQANKQSDEQSDNQPTVNLAVT
jgi:hypothetical protein